MKTLIIIAILGLLVFALTKAAVGVGHGNRRRGPRSHGGSNCSSGSPGSSYDSGDNRHSCSSSSCSNSSSGGSSCGGGGGGD
jgi:hypothetical protein